MGGWGSGRYGGRPTAEMSLRIDLAWMLRTGRASEGNRQFGSLNWTCGDRVAGSIGFTADMLDPENAWLELSYSRGSGESREAVKQRISLCYTVPNYGGRRWWMICPYQHVRVGKLYLPNGGDCFASRQAWRLGYHIQRVAHRDRPFEKLFRLQKKLGCDQGWEAGLSRPKGMWNQTFERHLERYWELDDQCAVEMMGLVNRLRGY